MAAPWHQLRSNTLATNKNTLDIALQHAKKHLESLATE